MSMSTSSSGDLPVAERKIAAAVDADQPGSRSILTSSLHLSPESAGSSWAVAMRPHPAERVGHQRPGERQRPMSAAARCARGESTLYKNVSEQSDWAVLQGNAGLLNTSCKLKIAHTRPEKRPQSSKARKHKRVFLQPEEDEFVFCDTNSAGEESDGVGNALVGDEDVDLEAVGAGLDGGMIMEDEDFSHSSDEHDSAEDRKDLVKGGSNAPLRAPPSDDEDIPKHPGALLRRSCVNFLEYNLNNVVGATSTDRSPGTRGSSSGLMSGRGADGAAGSSSDFGGGGLTTAASGRARADSVEYASKLAAFSTSFNQESEFEGLASFSASFLKNYDHGGGGGSLKSSFEGALNRSCDSMGRRLSGGSGAGGMDHYNTIRSSREWEEHHHPPTTERPPVHHNHIFDGRTNARSEPRSPGRSLVDDHERDQERDARSPNSSFAAKVLGRGAESPPRPPRISGSPRHDDEGDQSANERVFHGMVDQFSPPSVFETSGPYDGAGRGGPAGGRGTAHFGTSPPRSDGADHNISPGKHRTTSADVMRNNFLSGAEEPARSVSDSLAGRTARGGASLLLDHVSRGGIEGPRGGRGIEDVVSTNDSRQVRARMTGRGGAAEDSATNITVDVGSSVVDATDGDDAEAFVPPIYIDESEAGDIAEAVIDKYIREYQEKGRPGSRKIQLGAHRVPQQGRRPLTAQGRPAAATRSTGASTQRAVFAPASRTTFVDTTTSSVVTPSFLQPAASPMNALDHTTTRRSSGGRVEPPTVQPGGRPSAVPSPAGAVVPPRGLKSPGTTNGVGAASVSSTSGGGTKSTLRGFARAQQVKKEFTGMSDTLLGAALRDQFSRGDHSSSSMRRGSAPSSSSTSSVGSLQRGSSGSSVMGGDGHRNFVVENRRASAGGGARSGASRASPHEQSLSMASAAARSSHNSNVPRPNASSSHKNYVVAPRQNHVEKDTVRCYLSFSDPHKFYQVRLPHPSATVGDVIRMLSNKLGGGEKKVTLCLKTHAEGTPIWLCHVEVVTQLLEDWAGVSEADWPRIFMQVGE